MKQKYLKTIRVVIALVYLIAFSALFVDFREFFSAEWAKTITFLQFVPSVIEFITLPAITAAGFILILVLTALAGRIYCSALCPLGILQDLFTWFAKKIKLIKRYKYKKPLNYLRYPFLALTVLFILSGSIYVLNLLDPYSIFGRIFSDIIRPGIMVVNNGLSGLFEKMEWYFLYRINLNLITWRTVFIPIITLLVIVWLSLYYGRLYCNTVCPAGTLLGLLSRISVFKIRMNGTTCTQCGKCSVACKASCINIKNLEVDFSRCIACYDCIAVCPENSIAYNGKILPVTATTETDTSKRNFIGKTLLYGASLAGISKSLVAQNESDRPAGNIPNRKNYPVSPPGSVSITHFTSRCSACHLCVTVCPTNVLQPSFLEYGFTGMMQPRMDYAVEYCNYECTKCSEVCPTGAILPLTFEDKKLQQIGQVEFLIKKCIVYTDHTACGSCSEHCPTQAVTMIPFEDGLTIPETRKEICIGCGACEFACPVKPHTAIFVEGNNVHQVALIPEIQELEENVQEDFPF